MKGRNDVLLDDVTGNPRQRMEQKVHKVQGRRRQRFGTAEIGSGHPQVTQRDGGRGVGGAGVAGQDSTGGVQG